MASKKATPASIINLLARHKGMMNYVDEVLRVKKFVAVENQADHVKSRSAEYYEGLAYGANAMMENALFESGCYHGYSYVNREETISGVAFNPCIGPTHPEFLDWRREYHMRAKFAKALA